MQINIKPFVQKNVKCTKQETMKEEDLLRQKAGMGQPFKVPEGYWDSLSCRVMSHIQEHNITVPAKKRPLFSRRNVWACAAGVCALLIVGAAYYADKVGSNVALSVEKEASAQLGYDSYIDEVADCAMLDNQDFYSYMSGE